MPSENRSHILFIPSWYPTKEDPTLGIFIKRHAEALAQLHDITVLTVSSDATISENYQLATNEEKNVSTITVRYKKSSPSLFAPFIKLYRSLHAFRKGYNHILKERGKPQLIHLHVIYPKAISYLLNRKIRKIPLVISEHWSGYMKEDGNYKGTLMKMITRLTVNKAQAVMVVSQPMKEAMLSHGLKNTYHIIPNVIDSAVFYPPANGKPTGPKIITHVSSINDHEKNISGMLRTIKELSKKRADFTFNIIGDSAELPGFKKLAKELELSDKLVSFKGALLPDQLAEEMRKSDVFLLFSNYEGLPCVILEALACGLPVVASNTGGIPSVINEKNGILVAPKNEKELLEAIEKALVSNYNTEEISRNAIQQFSYEAVAKKINEVYSNEPA